MKDIPRLTCQQYRAVRRLVHECCNYDGGNCLALDNGWEPCVCVQSITYSLVCKWFRAAVLPGCVPLCSIEDGRGPAPSVGRCLCRAPTVGSIVTSAPPLCAGGRKPPTNGSAAGVDIYSNPRNYQGIPAAENQPAQSEGRISEKASAIPCGS